MNLPDWLGPVLDVAPAYARHVAVGAGIVGALLAAVLVWRFLRTGHAHTRVGTLAVVLATAFAAEGMWEVARGALELSIPVALVLFGMFEVVMVSQGLLAKHKLTQQPPGDVRRHIRFVWAVAAASGIVASTASSSVPEFLLRLFAPAVGAGIWWMGITADKPGAVEQPTSWIWTPRRIGIHLGLIQPGQQDLVRVDRDRRIDAMTVTAHRLHHGSHRLAGWRKAKLRRLALQADDAMVVEAQRRVARVHRIEQLTDPSAAVVEPSADEWALMDRTRRSMTEAATRIRTRDEYAWTSIVDQTPRPMWSNGLVQMRTSIADQIRTEAVDQARTNGRSNPVDRDWSTSDGVDQPETRDAAAARTTPLRRTAVRLDRVRPVSPAAAGDVPPRIEGMVRDLKRAYRGDIPGRRTVMDRMGWTSAGDAQTAINLVRAERTKTKKED
ncbi:hypothetical protein QTQ03_28060 [Micromonospora sp. WMMA1363]|uniref:hypothetical protein n=1 Tax=Micromonospora sp. WMMA1363 TaxID=3053985 RepID=UPI00259D2015|nr:hypothetical protein [Micromonospora sp. WMMA1363]MDM4721176.1 hypothetical protein [Micromonospora sp. WMMA1363]MDM4723264.1 hypothetical protein [Micromonospora sp. WMMA1363]